jgi:hypothetical protein
MAAPLSSGFGQIGTESGSDNPPGYLKKNWAIMAHFSQVKMGHRFEAKF